MAPGATVDIGRSVLPAPLRSGALGILDISEFFGETTGGVSTYLLEKARYVQQDPTLRQVLVVPGAADQILEGSGVRCYRLRGAPIPTQKPYRFMLATRSTSRIVAHERPDLIEIGSAWCAPWLIHLARRRLNVPTVWFYHSNFPRIIAPRVETAGWLRRSASAAAWRYVRRLAGLVHTTIAPSETVVRQLQHEGVGNVVNVPLGVDLQRFHAGRRLHAAETRRHFGLPEGMLAMYVGRIAGEKDLDVLLRGWIQVERRTGARLVIVGAGPARRSLTQAPGGDRVIWLPFQSDRDVLADLYAAVNLYVAPGPAETFGLASLEALASGNPVLSVNQGGVADTVTHSGAGALYRSGDHDDLARVAERLLSDDLSRLGEVGRAYVEAHHSWNRVFDRLFEVYRRVISS
ncbi:MAG TPA: glycosyltransferase [Gemmatimonadales bacterium]|nr:glycosyltransferase [Gemmatimonadales bacterium]